MYARSRALDVVEADLESHLRGLGLPQCVSMDPNSMKRLYRANLPADQMSRVSDILQKQAVLAMSRKEAVQVGCGVVVVVVVVSHVMWY